MASCEREKRARKKVKKKITGAEFFNSVKISVVACEAINFCLNEDLTALGITD